MMKQLLNLDLGRLVNFSNKLSKEEIGFKILCLVIRSNYDSAYSIIKKDGRIKINGLDQRKTNHIER